MKLSPSNSARAALPAAGAREPRRTAAPDAPPVRAPSGVLPGATPLRRSPGAASAAAAPVSPAAASIRGLSAALDRHSIGAAGPARARLAERAVARLERFLGPGAAAEIARWVERVPAPELEETQRALLLVSTRPELEKMRPAEAARVLTALSGDNHYLSQPLGRAVISLLRSRAFRASPSPSAALSRFLRRFPEHRSMFLIERGIFARARRATEVGPRVREASFAFESGARPALKVPITIGGHRVEVVRAAGARSAQGAFMHRIAEVARALGALPPAHVAHIGRIVLEPEPEKEPAGAAKKGGTPYLARDSAGVIHVYPQPTRPAQDELDVCLLHELGHAVAAPIFGEDDHKGAGYARWREAAASDLFAPSGYSRTRPAEDFAESYALYAVAARTGEAEDLRRMFPARWAILDELFGPDRLAELGPQLSADARFLFDRWRDDPAVREALEELLDGTWFAGRSADGSDDHRLRGMLIRATPVAPSPSKTPRLAVALLEAETVAGDQLGGSGDPIAAVRAALATSADVVVAPEWFGQAGGRFLDRAELDDRIEQLRDATRGGTALVVPGTFPWIDEEGRYHNTLMAFSRGQLLARYDKCLEGDDDALARGAGVTWAPGSEPPPVVRWRGLRVGLEICRDHGDSLLRWRLERGGEPPLDLHIVVARGVPLKAPMVGVGGVAIAAQVPGCEPGVKSEVVRRVAPSGEMPEGRVHLERTLPGDTALRLVRV